MCVWWKNTLTDILWIPIIFLISLEIFFLKISSCCCSLSFLYVWNSSPPEVFYHRQRWNLIGCKEVLGAKWGFLRQSDGVPSWLCVLKTSVSLCPDLSVSSLLVLCTCLSSFYAARISHSMESKSNSLHKAVRSKSKYLRQAAKMLAGWPKSILRLWSFTSTNHRGLWRSLDCNRVR